MDVGIVAPQLASQQAESAAKAKAERAEEELKRSQFMAEEERMGSHVGAALLHCVWEEAMQTGSHCGSVAMCRVEIANLRMMF